MKKELINDAIKSIKEMKLKNLNISLYDRKIAEYFESLIAIIEEELLNNKEDDKISSGYSLKAIRDLIMLEYNMEHFINTGELDQESNLELIKEENVVLDTELDKRQIIDLYKQIISLIGKMDSVDINKIKKIRNLWLEEKEDCLPEEQSEVEKSLAEAFLNYQIIFIQNSKRFPEDKIDDFCDLSSYEIVLKDRILKKISELPKISTERLDLEFGLTIWEFEELVKDKDIWRVIAGTDFAFGDMGKDSEKSKFKDNKYDDEPERNFD